MKTDMLHSIAVSWVGCLNRYVKKEGTDLQKMVLGMEIFLHNIPKLVLMVFVAYLVGILPQSLLAWLSFAIVRRYASGLHASNSIVCMLMTLVMFVAVPYVIQDTYMSVWILLLTFAIIGLGLYRYAPADTLAQPIIGQRKRARLKRGALTASLFLLISALVLNNGAFNAMIVSGALYALVAVLPLTYKILGRSMNNYEKYE